MSEAPGYAALASQIADLADANEALLDEVVELRRDVVEVRNKALEQAAYEVAELAAHDCAERDWWDGERVCMRIATGIRMMKGAKT